MPRATILNLAQLGKLTRTVRDFGGLASCKDHSTLTDIARLQI